MRSPNLLVAADTNLLRHPTTRRYVTVLEALRGRRIAVLPTVDEEMRKHVRIQARDFVQSAAERQSPEDPEAVDAASHACAEAAETWWQTERNRNDSTYHFVPDQGDAAYARVVDTLPNRAFTGKNPNDQWIYAQAMVHGVDVLASRNRKTIIVELLDEHFAARNASGEAVSVRNLWQHTAVIAKEEGRTIEEVAVETVMCAVVPERWERTGTHTRNATWSAERFIENLRAGNVKEPPDPEEEPLAYLLDEAMNSMEASRATELFDQAHLIRPIEARETEGRYHATTRKAVRCAGIDLWDG